MQLEPVEPAHGGFTAFGQLFEHLMSVNTAVVTHLDGRGIDEGDPIPVAEALR